EALRAESSAGPLPARDLAQPGARAVADVGAGRRAARRHPGRLRDGPAVLRRLRAGAREQQPHRRPRPAGLLCVLLADEPELAVRADAGTARHDRHRARADRAREAVVGDAQALRVAAAALPGARAGAREPGAAGELDAVSVRDGDLQRPAVLPVEVLLPVGALLRRLGLHRGVRAARRAQGADDAPLAARAPAAGRTATRAGRDDARARPVGVDRAGAERADDLAPWRAGSDRRRIARAARADGRPVRRRPAARDRAARPARPRSRRRAQRLSGQQDGQFAGDHGDADGRRLAPARGRRHAPGGALAHPAAGHGAADLRAADRLRRGLVDDADLDRRAAARPRRARGRRVLRRAAGRVPAGGRQLPPRDAERGPGRRSPLAARAARQRRRPVARSWVPGADRGAGAAGRALHEVGQPARIQSDEGM
ncbi:MAG: Putative transmembrane protein, partial [uncultured Solirubrobacteraceae bacterium]